MHTLLSITLLGLLLWASCIRADDTDAKQTETQEDASRETTEENPGEEEDTKEPPKKEKTTEIEEEKDVMVLHINNFARALSENQYLLVEFYAPWCGHCQQLEPLYAEAAGKLKKEEEAAAAMRLAKVDATVEMELAEEFDIGGFPTLKLFVNGDRKQPVDYTGKRTANGIIQWMKRRAGPGAPVLDSADSAAQFIDSHNITVVGFFDNLESEAAKVFKELALEITETEFAVSASPEVFLKYEVKANSVVLFKKSADKIFTSSIHLHSLLIINSSVESHKAILDDCRTIAKEFKGKMLFVVIDVTEALSNVLNYFGVSENDAPTARLINMDTGKKFRIGAGELTANSLRQLCQDVVDGTAKAYYRSEEIPEDWNKGPVKVLVGKNFESVALDPTKNVFVEFYAPWCAHCKELTPIWEQLGEKYADKDDIIIAKMDSTANEAASVAIQGFPTLKYFPAGGKEVVDYTGNRDLETLSKFLDNGGVLPEGGSDEEEHEDDEDDEDDEEGDGVVNEVCIFTATLYISPVIINLLHSPVFHFLFSLFQEADESAEVPTNETSKDEL
uniref:protein disulfide-isomerase n=1 Tax=Sander lucioperca TaxID=283035 RepID=A0A8C9X6Q5_SANLU